MPTPYEFGFAVGARTKAAAEKQSRGLVADLALYSNPWTGVPTGIYDTYNSLRKGNYLGAMGNVATTGLSFLGAGGAGTALKGLGAKALGRGATMATQGGMRGAAGLALKGVGHAANAAGGLATGGARVLDSVQAPVSQAIQKIVPIRQSATLAKAPVRSIVNFAVKNPLTIPALAHTGGNPTPPGPAVQAFNAARSYAQPKPQPV